MSRNRKMRRRLLVRDAIAVIRAARKGHSAEPKSGKISEAYMLYAESVTAASIQRAKAASN